MSRFKVSLIVPSYERPEATIRAIDCIMNQDFVGFEAYIAGDNCPFIKSLIDDGRADAYIQQAHKNGNKLSIFNMPHHYGGYGYQGRNTCIQLAYGDYTMFMDNDDVIKPDHITNYYNAISDTDNDLMYFNTILHPIEVRGKKGLFVRDSKPEEGHIGHAEVIVKTSVIKKIKPEEPNYNHDWAFLNQIFSGGYKFEKGNTHPTYVIMGLGELRENL